MIYVVFQDYFEQFESFNPRKMSQPSICESYPSAAYPSVTSEVKDELINISEKAIAERGNVKIRIAASFCSEMLNNL